MNKKYYFSAFFVLTVLIVLFFTLRREEDYLAVNFLDVGQGDAILIRSPEGLNILIDGGPDNKLLYQVADKLPWWERTIDYLIITHYHTDHYVGFMDLLDKYEVKHILVTANEPNNFLYYQWLEKLKEKNIKLSIVKAGEDFVVSPELHWQVLMADSEHEDLNENSLVVKLSYRETDFLLMGDLPISGEQKLLASGIDLDSELLKVGHHGSKYSSSAEFLSAVSPEICVIQSGFDNKFGHPHPETIARLEAVNCQIKNTQDLGSISFTFSY
ncbi:MAG: MBL fold metallo-hydrolase [bacterium]|nr:MBL fold metallo-hydrolase [bacterium]